MNKKIIASLILLCGITSAEYTIKIHLPQDLAIANKDNESEIPESPETPDLPLTVTPSTINRGGSAALNWSYKNLQLISIENESSYTSTELAGAFALHPLKTTTYNVLVKKNGQTAIEQITVNVNQPVPTANLTASSLKVGVGQPVTLSWNTTDAETVSIAGLFSNSSNTNSSMVVNPTANITYDLTAYGYEGQYYANKSVSIEVKDNAVINSFTVNNNKLTVGESGVFNWNVSNAEAITFDNAAQPLSSTGSKSILYVAPGNYSSTLAVTSFGGSIVNDTKAVTVYAIPIIMNFKINNATSPVPSEPSAALNITWTNDGTSTYKLNGTTVTGSNTTLTAPATVGLHDYVLEATNPAGRTVSSTVQVNVNLTPPPVVTNITAPSNVFRDSPFTLSFTATGATNYKIKGNTNASGISGTVDLGTATSKVITPTLAGNFTYTITATNAVGVSVTSQIVVTAESLPTVGTLIVGTTAAVANTVSNGDTFTLTWTSTNAGVFSINQGVGVVASSPATITPPTTNGDYVYTVTNSKTLNGITNTASKSVTVSVVPKPVITSFTGPSSTTQYTPTSLHWTGSADIVYYTLSGDSANNGSQQLYGGTQVVTPQTKGAIIYTLKARTTAGGTATRTFTLIVN